MVVPNVYRVKFLVILVAFCFTSKCVFCSVIESSGDGNYCFNRIPKRGVAANCASERVCEDLLSLPATSFNELRCGDQGECITKELPRSEFCKAACEKSTCAKFCLQEHEIKTAMYCIETRDHPNAMPGGTSGNKYYCTCIDGNASSSRDIRKYFR